MAKVNDKPKQIYKLFFIGPDNTDSTKYANTKISVSAKNIDVAVLQVIDLINKHKIYDGFDTIIVYEANMINNNILSKNPIVEDRKIKILRKGVDYYTKTVNIRGGGIKFKNGIKFPQ